MDTPNGQAPQGASVDAEVVARSLAQRLGAREAEHSWELAVRDARIDDLQRQLQATHEALEQRDAQRDGIIPEEVEADA